MQSLLDIFRHERHEPVDPEIIKEQIKTEVIGSIQDAIQEVVEKSPGTNVIIINKITVNITQQHALGGGATNVSNGSYTEKVR